VDTIAEYGAAYQVADIYGFIVIERIRADADSEFASGDFKTFVLNIR
jgi:hypothetical protein